jgi:hypothetical protein
MMIRQLALIAVSVIGMATAAPAASPSATNNAIAEIARNPTLNPASAKDIINTSRNLGDTFGVDLSDGFRLLTTALEGGANGIIDLGLRLNALSAKQVAEILNLNRTIGAQAAVKKGYEAITAKLKPYQNSRIDQVGPTDSQTDSYAVSARDCAEFMGRRQRELQLFHNQTEQQSRETAAEMEIISEEAAGRPTRTKAQLLARGCD